MLFLTIFDMLLVEYMYSLVVPVKVASPVAMVQVCHIIAIILYLWYTCINLCPTDLM